MWILKYVTKEFYTYSVDKIKDCIENPRVSCEPVFPGMGTLEKLDVDRISGMSTESIIVNEGEIDFDVRFNVYTPEILTEKIIVDVEAQNDYYPGYDLVTRGIFYNARQMSSQLETEFTVRSDDRIKYGNIKKVYSIWLCLDCPQYVQNTITSYDIKPTKLFGDFSKNVRYDLMSVVVVCLDNCMADIEDDGDMEGLACGESEVRYEDFLRMLTVLLFHVDFEKKKQILESYGIPMEEKLREDVMEMCNLSKGIEERGVRKGIKQGIQQGMQLGYKALAAVVNLLRTGKSEEEIKNMGYDDSMIEEANQLLIQLKVDV